MKKNIFLFLAALLQIFAGEFAFAKNDLKLSERQYSEKIFNSCKKNYNAPKGDHSKVCQCITDRLVKYSRTWKGPSGSQNDVLDYVSKYYSAELSQKEIDRDPLNLDDQLYYSATECAAESK